MSSEFNCAIDEVANIIAIPQSDHELFLERVDAIKTVILQKMDDTNAIFKGMIQNLEETAVFVKESYVDFPINCNSYLKIKMPFEIEPDFMDITQQSVQLRTEAEYPFVVSGRIMQDMLKILMDSDLKGAISSIGDITCKDGAVFKLSYELDLIWDGYTIKATKNDDDNASIIFAFVPAIVIMKNNDDTSTLPNWISESENQNYWLAVTLSDNDGFNYYGINHLWQSVNSSDKIKAKNLMLLLHKFCLFIGVPNSNVIAVNERSIVINMLDLKGRELRLGDPLGDLLMNCISFIPANTERRLYFDSEQVPYTNDEIFQQIRKLLNFNKGQESFNLNDIKKLFGI